MRRYDVTLAREDELSLDKITEQPDPQFAHWMVGPLDRCKSEALSA
jgi:hypothetical protein